VKLWGIIEYNKYENITFQLQELDLSWCEEITEEGLNQVALRCRSLRRWLLRQCPLTDTTIQLVAENCINLRHLNLSSFYGLVDRHLVALSLRLKHMEHLDISWSFCTTWFFQPFFNNIWNIFQWIYVNGWILDVNGWNFIGCRSIPMHIQAYVLLFWFYCAFYLWDNVAVKRLCYSESYIYIHQNENIFVLLI
jgi:hypothetical protein